MVLLNLVNYVAQNDVSTFHKNDPMLCTPAVGYGRPNIAVELLNLQLGIRKVTGHISTMN